MKNDAPKPKITITGFKPETKDIIGRLMSHINLESKDTSRSGTGAANAIMRNIHGLLGHHNGREISGAPDGFNTIDELKIAAATIADTISSGNRSNTALTMARVESGINLGELIEVASDIRSCCAAVGIDLTKKPDRERSR
jgi:hypothetical protein